MTATIERFNAINNRIDEYEKLRYKDILNTIEDYCLEPIIVGSYTSGGLEHTKIIARQFVKKGYPCILHKFIIENKTDFQKTVTYVESQIVQ